MVGLAVGSGLGVGVMVGSGVFVVSVWMRITGGMVFSVAEVVLLVFIAGIAHALKGKQIDTMSIRANKFNSLILAIEDINR
jgi:hypothetical protein